MKNVNMKAVKGASKCKTTAAGIRGRIHTFTDDEIESMRNELLKWYDVNKRDLPWRVIKHEEANQRAYAVWVSEIMAQQTQVAIVVDFYNRWMTKWPTLESLSRASLEEVREMWSGLGYYSRGQRLLEGALKVQNQLSGLIPSNAVGLQKELPGVGRYTAGAIASIAFNEPTGVVDGNVIRVLTRMRIIAADSTSQVVVANIWKLANALVDPDRPGDFNQSMMELGATVCLPKNPQCASCPVRAHCKASSQAEVWKRETTAKLTKSNGCAKSEEDILDIECSAEGCVLCAAEPLDVSVGVLNYPRKPKKNPPKQQVHAVCVIEKQTKTDPEYLVVQRPDTGLLAGLWEFPSAEIASDASQKIRRNKMDSYLSNSLHLAFKSAKDRRHVSQVIHIFSHIHQTYEVETFKLTASDIKDSSKKDVESPTFKWVCRATIKGMAISTAMRKVFNAFDGKGKKSQNKRSADSDSKASKQKKLDSFFTKK